MNSINNLMNEIEFFQEAELKYQNKLIAWQSIAFNKEKKPLGGGVHREKDIAKKIAIAEVLERKFFSELSHSEENLKNKFLLNKYPSTCGFAAGFDREKTKFRAIAEAVERWAWSKWIDEGFKIDRVNLEDQNLSELSLLLASYFNEVLLFKISINTSSIENFESKVNLGIVLGIKDEGIFPGSRVAAEKEELWDHGFVEAWRHLEIFKKHDFTKDNKIPLNRIQYFAKNKAHALNQISNSNKLFNLTPKSMLLLEHDTKIEGLYLWRSLMKDFKGWDVGDEKRFVY